MFSGTVANADKDDSGPVAANVGRQGTRSTLGTGEMAERVRGIDWSLTSLGPMEIWPDFLTVLVNLVMVSHHPVFLFWGKDLTQFYNDAAIPLVGPDMHPAALGQSARTSSPQMWATFGAAIEAACEGQASHHHDQMFTVSRDGRLCEAWFSVSVAPVADPAGNPVGALVSCMEDTHRVLAETAVRSESSLLLTVFEHAPAILAVLRGPEHVFEMANPAYLRLIGGREIIGMPVREALPEVVEQGYADLLDRVYRTRQPYVGRDARVMLASADGQPPQERRLDFVYQPLLNDEGQPSGILVFAVDITDRTETERQLRHERDRFEFATAAANVGYWFCNLPFDRMDWDHRVKEHFWLPPDSDVDIEMFYRRLHPDDREPTRRAMEEAIEKGTTYDVQYRTVSPAGEQKWIHAIGRTGYSPDGTPVRFDGLTRDITALKEAEEARRRAEDALIRSEKLAVVGRLAATISHEINNPLESVMNLLYLIETATSQDEKIRTYTRSAQEELARVSHIVTHTLRFNRQTPSGAKEFLGKILDSTVAIYEGRLRHMEIRLDVDCEAAIADLPFSLDLRQVFANLVGNAFDASERHGRILLRARAQRHPQSGAPGVRVSVADAGHGIAPATRRSLFEPFFTTKGAKGTGLGLWVSREILQRHGASIRVKSKQQEGCSGTVFSVWLPAHPAPPAGRI